MLVTPILGALVLGAMSAAATLDSSQPVDYPGMPSGNYSTEWQQYFQVTDSLPGIGFDLGNNYAGNIGVQRPHHTQDSLFFWGFEKENGSLTAAAGDRDTEPWAIWLQGGPGTSSLYGLFSENGPISLAPDTQQFTQNEYAWSNLIDYIWVDQPVGVGFATAHSDGYAVDEDQIGADFIGFLENLVQVFPSLATRPFYLTGESYAGRYIPYIVKALFSSPNPPVKLAKMVVGDPAFGSNDEFKTMPTSGGNFPTINIVSGGNQNGSSTGSDQDDDVNKKKNGSTNNGRHSGSFTSTVAKRHAERVANGWSPRHEENISKRDTWKRDLGGRSNSSIDPWYGCFVWDEMVDYAVNFTYPWNASLDFDTFDAPDALNPETSVDPTFFLNKPTVGDPSPEPMAFFTELATNATNNGVQIVIYVGNDDAISPHFGTEVTIQNTTFGGIQGFTRKPSTPWFDDDGNWAGIVHQERNWTYALVYGTGHEVAAGRPVAAYTFVREFVLGNNQTGLVMNAGGSASVVGGENPTLEQTAIPGQLGIANLSCAGPNLHILDAKHSLGTYGMEESRLVLGASPKVALNSQANDAE
ncbi:hypothetical protein EW026_g5196 [Hermanssonia centrifuga]|uniref:Carboxypeptidase n=1 Tax=Hermanssonia centrifuga TaxID=98765 RepID=A0A4S4KJ68_9APHY|nr:hypothetical protein EW026_g5196 [Hermanssonia centrifuga]